jgi:hypothetical protein
VTGFGGLVKLFLRDLVRRKFLWVLVVLTLAMVGLTYATTRTMEEAIGNGETWEMATRRATNQLESFASWMRPWLAFAVVLLAAQLAPESRRNGTTQFVLALGVRRHVVAAAQFAALTLVLTAGVLIVHAGFVVAGLRAGNMHANEIAASWVTLLAPLLAIAASVLSISLTASALETYLIFLAVPLLASIVPTIHGVPKVVPLALVRALENLNLLVPNPTELTTWPRLTFGDAHGPPSPEWGLLVAQACTALAFWMLLGLWRQSRHDFGSRTATK